jgi:MFS family permease
MALQVSMLGIVTIGSYSIILYRFGAFVTAIRYDPGWLNTTIGAAFSISTLVGGVASLQTGRLFDRVGAQPVMLVPLVLGSMLLVVAYRTRSRTRSEPASNNSSNRPLSIAGK